MIPRSVDILQTDMTVEFPLKSSWQQQWAEAIRDPETLLKRLDLPLSLLPAARQAAKQFPLRVPEAFLRRIQPGQLHNPLLRQILPLGEELLSPPEYQPDPVGDNAAMRQPGLLHKYHGRALLLLSEACAIHCRYCFRRHFPYQEARPLGRHWQQIRQQLMDDDSLEEIILSGGDPLALDDEKLLSLIRDLETIPHLQRLRIHSRLPVVLPARVTPALIKGLQQSRLQVIIVLHANHPQELDIEVQEACERLRNSAITLLNQAVLLKGINDDAGCLEQLSQRLFEIGVMPYYLHLLDKVEGAAHFDVAEAQAREIMVQLRQRLPGYLVPRLVREVAGEAYKRPIDEI